MKKAIYPGTFDPVTLGHLDVIERSSKIFDELVVGVLVNNAKTPMFTSEERVGMLRSQVQRFGNVRVEAFDGLLIDFAVMEQAEFIVRGLRAVTDFDYELQMSQTNRVMQPGIDTIFLTTSLKYAYLSSSTVREVAAFGGDISQFVSPEIELRVHEKLAQRKYD